VGRIAAVLGELSAKGAPVPQRDAKALADDAMVQFLRRGVVRRDGDRVVIVPGQEGLVTYYANSIAHHFAPAAEDAATAEQ
jgi:glycerol-3-phosphate O-acyltransferase